MVEAFHYRGPGAEFAAWMAAMGENGSGGVQPGGPAIGTEAWCAPRWTLGLLTVEGDWDACTAGEWIVRDAPGRYHRCPNDEFWLVYEEVLGVIPDV
jgi:hypothetical protein